jgi:hypothetical protein
MEAGMGLFQIGDGQRVTSLMDWPAVVNRDESDPGQPPSKQPVAQNAQTIRTS